MDLEDKLSLHKSRVTLVEDLEPQKVLSYLEEDGILTENDVELISNGKTREKRCQLLLSMLPKRGPFAYGSFQRALRETNMYPRLERLLRMSREDYTKTSVDNSCFQGDIVVTVADYEKNIIEAIGNEHTVENIAVKNTQCITDYDQSFGKNLEKGRNVCDKCRPFFPKFNKRSQVSQICRRHCCLLFENIEPIDILDLHIQEQILSDDECERIRGGSTRKERCKTFFYCLAKCHDARVVSVLKESLKKKYRHIVDTINANKTNFEQFYNDTEILENKDNSISQKPYVSPPHTNLPARPTNKLQTERNHCDGAKTVWIKDESGQLKSPYNIASSTTNSVLLNITASSDTDKDDIVPKLCKISIKMCKSEHTLTHCSHYQGMEVASRDSLMSDTITIQPGAITQYELPTRRLVVTFNFLSSIINQGNFKRFESLSSTLQRKYHQEPNMLCLLGYFNASTELFKKSISSAKKHIESALKIAPRTNNPKYFTLELFTAKARIYIMKKKMEKLQELMDDAKMIIEADPAGCTGRAAGWLYLDESKSIMIQTSILDFRKKRSFDTYTWLQEKAKISLKKALANFQKDGSKDGPFGFGYSLCLLVILLLRCGENGLTMGVLSPPDEDVKQAGDLLRQFENSEIPIAKILEVDYYVAKSDYLFRKGNNIRALEHARRAFDLANEMNLHERVPHAYNRLVFLRAKNAPLLIRELNEETSDDILCKEPVEVDHKMKYEVCQNIRP